MRKGQPQAFSKILPISRQCPLEIKLNSKLPSIGDNSCRDVCLLHRSWAVSCTIFYHRTEENMQLLINEAPRTSFCLSRTSHPWKGYFLQHRKFDTKKIVLTFNCSLLETDIALKCFIFPLQNLHQKQLGYKNSTTSTRNSMHSWFWSELKIYFLFTFLHFLVVHQLLPGFWKTLHLVHWPAPPPASPHLSILLDLEFPWQPG